MLWTRRATLAGSGAAFLSFQGALLPGSAHGADPGSGGGAFEEEQQRRLIDTYWQELGSDEADVLRQFASDAATVGTALGAAPSDVEAYVDLATELHTAGSGRRVTLLPHAVEAVPVGLGKLSDSLSEVARFVMPFLSVTPAGGVFEVLDVAWKAASWLANSPLFRSTPRSEATQHLVPTVKARIDDWISPLSGRRIAGSTHRTLRREIFVSRDTISDASGQDYHVIGVRDPGDTSSTRLFQVRLI